MVSTRLSLIGRIGEDESDSEAIRLEKTTLVYASVVVITATTLWGMIYLIYQELPAALISLGYSAIALADLLYFSRSRRITILLYSQISMGLLLPFFQNILLGGFWNSGGVFIWSMISVIAALIFLKPSKARLFWMAYLVLLIGVAALQSSVQHENNMPPLIRQAFFVLNVGGVSGIVILILYFFIGQKDEAYRLLHIEQQKSEGLLLNILPSEIAYQLKNEARTIADSFEGVSVMFADLVGFTPLTANLEPVEIVNLLNEIFSYFDSLAEKFGVEKIRTIGDNYMVAAGVPCPMPDHACRLAAMALDIQSYLRERPSQTAMPVSFRIGINSGPVIGGVIGHKKYVYDIWGDAVNIASRMESHGVAGKIQITRSTYELIKDSFICERRGTVEVKGRGAMETWFLLSKH